MPVNWNMPGPQNNALAYFNQGVSIGNAARERQDRSELRKALATVAANPDDPSAIAPVFERSPELGMKLYDRQDERAFKSALGDYMQGNPMLGLSQPNPHRNAMLDVAVRPAFGQAPGAGQGVNAPVPGRQDVTPASPDPKPDFAFLGDPQDARDHAFLKMLERDPEKALKIRSTMRDNFMHRIKGERDFYGIAIEELARVQDDAGWQAALSRLEPYAQALGVDMGEGVPLNYPGPQEVRTLMEQALPVKERLDYLARAANTEADNERANRNTDSLIATRNRRAGEYERHNRVNEGNTRRGQDMTDKRGRDRQSAPGRSARERPSLPVITTPEEARKLPSGTKFRAPDGRVLIAP